LFWTFAVLAPVTGIWLTAGFHHLPRWRVWLGWWLCLVVLLLTPVIISAGIGELPPQIHQVRNPGNSLFYEGLRGIVFPGALVHVAIMAAALAGIPIGRVLLWLTSIVQRKIWRMRRKQRRMARVV
jgi:hypothetical protein